ncbi:hypothetical protein MD484_g8583, partial [Candolleomyces efflorescens]
MVKPSCFVCTNEYDPVERQPVRIACGHCVCALCMDEIVSRSTGCPLRCRAGARLRYRDARVVDISVVETNEHNDIAAVVDLNRSLVVYRRMLLELVDRNITRSKRLENCISVQQETLSRFSLQIRTAVRDQKGALYMLKHSENRLRAEVEHEKVLLDELATLQRQLRTAAAARAGAASADGDTAGGADSSTADRNWASNLLSVNCLAFTSDARYLASGDDNGLVIVTDMQDSSRFDRYHFKDAVTAMLWLTGRPKLVVGLANCEVHFISLEDEQAYTLSYAPSEYADLDDEWRHLIQINSLAYDPSTKLLAISVSTKVIVVSVRNFQKGELHLSFSAVYLPTSISLGHFHEKAVIGPVGRDPLKNVSGPPPNSLASEVTSTHFLKDGVDLLVTFLEEGIRLYSVASREQKWHIRPKSYRIGMSAVDSGEALMICSNLYDGFDLYNIQERSYVRTIRREIPRSRNVMLPALFVCHNSDLDSALLLGSASGQVQILSSTGDVYHRLTHGNEIIQAIAYGETDQGTRIIATGSAENGEATYVRIWIKPRAANDSDTIRRQLKEDFMRHSEPSTSAEAKPQCSTPSLRHRRDRPAPVSHRQTHDFDPEYNTQLPSSCFTCVTFTAGILFSLAVLSFLISADRLTNTGSLEAIVSHGL